MLICGACGGVVDSIDKLAVHLRCEEKPQELVVVENTSTNNARSEIAAICIELDCCMYEKFTKEMYVELRRRLRQLSSVA